MNYPKSKEFIVRYKFTDTTTGTYMKVLAISMEHAKEKVKKEIAMCYGSYLASKLILID